MEGFSVTVTEAVCLGASLAFSGIFFYLHRKSKTTVNKLDNAPHFTIDEKLKDLLKVTPGACLRYAVVEGAVEPVGKPLMSHFHKEIAGVLQRFTLKEHKLVWSSISRIWLDTEQILHQRVNMVPFLLAGLDNTTVKVQSPLEASGVHTEITNEKFHQASYSLGQLVLQYLSGEKPKGHLEIEEMLKVGTTLTGIGELILDTDGTVCLRPPSDNSQYFLSMADFEILRREYDSIANWWKALTIASVLAGAATLFWVGLRFYRHLKDRWQREQESREFARLQAEALRPPVHESGPDAAQNGAGDDARNVCVICLSQPRDCILLDCGHVCCCYVCFQSLPRRRCPICRRNIVRVLPFFQS
ncbi:mitochondrial ubiquitin ligase activator of nfkb 1-A [Xenentodon cancila]